MSDRAVPQVGEWVVAQDAWGLRVGVISKVTAQTVLLTMEERQELKRVDRARVIFSGAEVAAKRLAEQIGSSDAQCDEERRNSYLRHTLRVKGFVSAAHDGGDDELVH